MLYAKGTFYYEDFVYQASEPISPCYRQTKWYSQKIPSITGILSAKRSKLQHMHVIGLILLSVLKAKKNTWLYPATYYCARL